MTDSNVLVSCVTNRRRGAHRCTVVVVHAPCQAPPACTPTIILSVTMIQTLVLPQLHNPLKDIATQCALAMF